MEDLDAIRKELDLFQERYDVAFRIMQSAAYGEEKVDADILVMAECAMDEYWGKIQNLKRQLGYGEQSDKKFWGKP